MDKPIVSRRKALDFGLLAAASATLPGCGEAVPDRAIGPQTGDLLVAVGDPRHQALRPDAIRAGAAPVLAWPMDRRTGLVRDATRLNQVLLLRWPEGLDAERPDDAQPGELLAFSAICAHAGCVVSIWLAQSRLLRCPCHGSEYDPAREAAVVAGPASQPLPALPVRVIDAVVTVAGPFSTRPGGHTGRTD